MRTQPTMPDIITQLTNAIKDKTWTSESDFPLTVVQWNEGDAMTLREEVQQFTNCRDDDMEMNTIEDAFAGQDGLEALQVAMTLLVAPMAFKIETEDAAKFDLLLVGWYGDDQIAGVRTTVVQT